VEIPNFNRVIVKADTGQSRNIHLAVHPFRMPRIAMMSMAGMYDYYGVPPAKQPLAERLWSEIPGLRTLFFRNGEITIQHNGLFSDEEIVQAATAIITPHLEEQLSLEQLA
jgi:hypothetical protein